MNNNEILNDYMRKSAAIEFAIEAIVRDSVFSVAGKIEALEVLFDELHSYKASIKYELEKIAANLQEVPNESD